MDISFQLYSARNFAPWENIYQLLGVLGYTQVEGFGAAYEDVEKTKSMLDKNELAMPTGHFFPIDAFEKDFDKTIKTAKFLGMSRVFCPAPEDFWRNGTDSKNWISLAKRLEEVCKRVNDAGLSFGWHNHHWEFEPIDGDKLPMELILEYAPSIDWEIDVAWVVRGHADPLEWISKYSDRITTAHVKDLAPEGQCTDEDGWADPGYGTIDWKKNYVALCNAGVDIFIMEHDNPSDIERFASRAIETMRKF